MTRIATLVACLALLAAAPAASAAYYGACVPPAAGARVACVGLSTGDDTQCWESCGGVTCYGAFLLEGGSNEGAGSSWDTFFVRCSGDPSCEEYFDMQSDLLGRHEKTCDYAGPIPSPMDPTDALCGESYCLTRLS